MLKDCRQTDITFGFCYKPLPQILMDSQAQNRVKPRSPGISRMKLSVSSSAKYFRSETTATLIPNLKAPFG